MCREPVVVWSVRFNIHDQTKGKGRCVSADLTGRIDEMMSGSPAVRQLLVQVSPLSELDMSSFFFFLAHFSFKQD